MNRKHHDLIQGTDAWHEFRAVHFTASDAPAMMGVSKYKGRSALLKEKATGSAPSVDRSTQARFNRGHELEAIARDFAIEIIGEDLFSPTMSLETDGLSLSASLDGITMIGDVIWEHKTLNAALAENIPAGLIDKMYQVQMEQQLLVSGAEKCLFMASAGDKESMVYCWYESNQELRQEIIAGWEQFKRDLAEYEPEAKQEVITATESVTLPALTAHVEGTMVVSNIADSLPALRAMAEQEVNKSLETDLDFANKEALIKSVKTAREKLKKLSESTISNFESLQEFKDAASEADAILQKVQSHGEKQVKSRKEEIKAEIIKDAQSQLDNCIADLVWSVKNLMPNVTADFAGAIKGKRNIQSMKDALSEELAKAKIEVNRIAVKIGDNLTALDIEAADYKFLFSDLQQIALKDNADFVNLVKLRVAEHKAAEEKRKAQEKANKVALGCAQASKVETAEEVKQPPHENAPINGSVSARNVSINKTLAEALGDWCASNGIDSCAVGDLFQLLSIYHIDLSVQKAA